MKLSQQAKGSAGGGRGTFYMFIISCSVDIGQGQKGGGNEWTVNNAKNPEDAQPTQHG